MRRMCATAEHEAEGFSTARQGSTLALRRTAVAHAKRALPPALRVVLYHHLSDRPTELEGPLHVNTPPSLFEEHIQRLSLDYEVVDLETVISGRLPRRALLITFDDGYRSVLDIGLPVLARHDLPSVFFVSAAFVDPTSIPLDNLLCWLAARTGVGDVAANVLRRPAVSCTIEELVALTTRLPYWRRTRLGSELSERYSVDTSRIRSESKLFLELGELPRLAELGCVVGNHTRSHVACHTIPNDEVAAVELIEHQRDLEHWTGSTVKAFSYPYGSRRDATPFVERVLAESNHQASFLAESRPNRASQPRGPWNRVSLHHESTARLTAELELLPQLRALRDFLSSAAVNVRLVG